MRPVKLTFTTQTIIRMNTTVKWLLTGSMALFLSACVSKAPDTKPAATLAEHNLTKVVVPSASAADSAFKPQLVIMPDDSIEKDLLKISYSLKPLPNEENTFLLSLTFRNKKNKNITLHPKIALTDKAGVKIEAYSKNRFIKLAKQIPDSPAKLDTAAKKTSHQAQTDEKIKWAHSYWLKDQFTVPADGIDIGELVFHCKQACQPKHLSVQLGKQEFSFTLNDAYFIP